MSEWVFDIEANMLLEDAIDYTTSPYSIKEDFKIHYVSFVEVNTRKIIAFYDGESIDFNRQDLSVQGTYGNYSLYDYTPITYDHYQLSELKDWIKREKPEVIIGHNIIDYDLAVLHTKMDILVDLIGEKHTWEGNETTFIDTLLFSKVIDPDIFGGHSLDNLAKLAGKEQKYKFRKGIPESKRFLEPAPDMLYYNIFDVISNLDVYNWLRYKSRDWDCIDDVLKFEAEYKYIITQGTHRGFKFNSDKAGKYIEFLDQKMKEAREEIEPLLPPRPATKKFLGDHTPPKNQIKVVTKKVPKNKVKQNGEPTTAFLNFLEALGSEWDSKDKSFIYNSVKYSLPLEQEEFIISEEPSSFLLKFLEKYEGKYLGDLRVEIFDKEYKLPLAIEPLKTEMVATLDDTTHIKEWLVGTYGWNPSEYSEKDLLWTSGANKRKRSREEAIEAVNKYVAESIESPFLEDRLVHLEMTRNNFRMGLLRKVTARSLKVLSNPKFTVGQNKDVCKGLKAIAEKFPYAKDVVEFLTYRHRRNSILGGGADFSEDEDDSDYKKGYLAQVRPDGRIPTRADTIGTPTNRMKHKGVANIPATRSLFGKEMRSLFGVDIGYVQGGYDFDQLEGKAEANEVWEFDDGEGKPYCVSLLQDKPNDVHTKTAAFISDMVGFEFSRQSAKAVKYGCLPVDNSEVLTRKGWKNYKDLSLGMDVLSYNQSSDQYEWKPIDNLWFYNDAPVILMENKWISLESTEDHRWYGLKRRMKGSNKNSIRYYEKEFFTTGQVSSEYKIRHASIYRNDQSKVAPREAALVAWLLSDGYYVWSSKREITSSSNGKCKGITANISQAKHKFWREVEEVLQGNEIKYTRSEVNYKEGKLIYNYILNSKDIRDFLDRVVGSRENKHEVDWVSWILSLDQPSIQEFLYHFHLADGHIGKQIITQNEGNIHDSVMLAINLSGKRGISTKRTDSHKCRSIHINDNPYSTGQRLVKKMSRRTDVFCLTNENGSFVTRQNGFITLTGNCTYGAQAAKIAKTVGCDLATAEKIYDAFWEAARPLKVFKDNIIFEWKQNGKKYIKGLDGRRIATRKEHAVVNSDFQSFGSICAKKVIVYHHRLMKNEGFLVDFFKEDWANRSFCQQMISYHRYNCGFIQ